MSLVNFYSIIKPKKQKNPNFDQHGIEMPFRALIACASGGGKSNLVLNILYEMNQTFHKIIIVSKAAEPLYDHLSKVLRNVQVYYDGQVPEIEKMPEGQYALMVFDDMVLSPNNKIGEMFIRGRKIGYSSIYITQSFFGTPKIVRQNINYCWLGRGMARRDLRMILSEFALGGISLNELERIYSEITAEPMNFMMIDTVARNIRRNIKEVLYTL